jgi:SagB-type dehydrogenase family enzyme
MFKLNPDLHQAALLGAAERAAREPLFELFHENTKYTRARYQAQAARIATQLHSRQAVEAMSHNFKVYRFAEKWVLAEHEPLSLPLSHALAARVSTRTFSGQAISLAELASVLIPAAACNRRAAVKEFPPIELHLRSYPSGGGEFPVEVYVVLLRIADASPGIAHFDPRAKALSLIAPHVDVRELSPVLMHGESVLQSAAVLIVLTAIFERTIVKYGDRGYRLILLEAGHLAQNICLTAAASGLGSLAWGGFYDDELHRLLGIDGVNEAVVHALFIGKVAP